jgi:hypothetical protein
MDWADYLRDEAAKYRQLAETAEDLSIKQELLDLAAVCEEAANNIIACPAGNWRWRTADFGLTDKARIRRPDQTYPRCQGRWSRKIGGRETLLLL